MRRLGSILMVVGAIVGVGTGVAVLTGADIPGVGSWLVAVAVAKLGFIGSFALIAAGAVLRRADKTPEQPEASSPGALSSGTAPIQPIAKRDPIEQERR